MRIAIISDTHLGYARFEEDSFVQAERAFLAASESADLILFAGDVFDTKIPKLETLDRAISIFKKIRIPVYAIHGNHERRTKEQVNPARLLHTSGVIRYLHGESAPYEMKGEKLQIFGIGNVPDEYAEAAVKKAMERFNPEPGAFKILLIHQSIKELLPHGSNELSLDYLETLPFDLIVNGHLHGKEVLLGGRFLIPGSTVVTQLRKDETGSKGFFMFDTGTRKADFVPIDSRPFFYEELSLKDANESEVMEAVRKRIGELKQTHPGAIISLKIDGTMKDGMSGSDIKLPEFEHVFIDNRMDSKSLTAKIGRIRDLRNEKLSVRELALKELEEKTKGKVTAFDPVELFEKLVEGPDETMDYLNKVDKDGKTAAGS